MSARDIEGLVAALEKEIEWQRQHGGDYMDYGTPDPWLTEAATALLALKAENDALREARVFDIAAMIAAAEDFDAERTIPGTDREETPEDCFRHFRKRFPIDIQEAHYGDCIKVPMSCGRCWAAHYVERARAILRGSGEAG